MNDTPWDYEALLLSKFDASALKVDDEAAFKNKEKFVVVIVFVPVIFPLHDAETNDRIVHLAQCLVVPAVGTRGDQRGHVDEL